jgi:hypothetical protein
MNISNAKSSQSVKEITVEEVTSPLGFGSEKAHVEVDNLVVEKITCSLR